MDFKYFLSEETFYINDLPKKHFGIVVVVEELGETVVWDVIHDCCINREAVIELILRFNQIRLDPDMMSHSVEQWLEER